MSNQIYYSFSSCPLLGSSLPYWSTGLITQFLDLSQAAVLLGRVISSSQCLYLNTREDKHRKKRTHIKHPYPRRNSNPQSRPPSDRRLFMPQIARLPRPANLLLTGEKSKLNPFSMVMPLCGEIVDNSYTHTCSSIQFNLFACKRNNPTANYKASTSREERTHTYKQTTKPRQ
jgi:hypothetical protein